MHITSKENQIVALLELALISMTVGYVHNRFMQRDLRCSENLPESQRLKRNCTPLKPMRLHLLEDAFCNDGSRAGYYIRKKAGSKNWLIYLEGGGYCYSKETCADRMFISQSRKYSLVSILNSSKKKFVTGILSTQRKTNPLWWNANHVYVPYCSSDIWTGNNTGNGGFSFLGARIIDSVIDDLWRNRGFSRALNLTLAGSSAGGTGVMLNIDRVADNLEKRGSPVYVRGIVDSGWFLDNDVVRSKNCDGLSGPCKPSDVIKAAMKYWNADLPLSCTKDKPEDERHLCLFGNEIYPTLKRPIFVIQWIYDLAQIREDNPELGKNPMLLGGKEYFPYMTFLGQRVRQSLSTVRNYFAPSCLGHTIITREHWHQTRVNRKVGQPAAPATLLDALSCWLAGKDSCQYKDKCLLPHCSKYCSNVLETHNGDIPVQRLPGPF